MTPQTAPSSGTTPILAAQDALQSVTASVALARGLATTGRRIDLAGIDAAAGRLCAQVLDLPPSMGATFRPALIELRSSIGALAALLDGDTQ